MDKKGKSEDGVIALEASLSLCLFMFLVLLMYSFFLVFSAQYSIEHALLETGKSMCMESYATNKVLKTTSTSVGDLLIESGSIGTIVTELGLTSSVQNNEFTSYTKWYDNNQDTVNVAKNRFYAYLAGSEKDADFLLKQLRVKNGVSGLDFTGTRVVGDDLYIQVTYTSELIFNFSAFNMGDIEITLTTQSALWK